MWLGIDIGTGGSRALLVDERGAVRASCTAPHEDMTMERPLWAEQRPENWWDAAEEAIRGALAEAGVSGAAIRGIGLSGQMHGLVILDGASDVDPSRADLVRSAQPGAGGCRQRQAGPRKRSALHRQPGADRLHPAQAAVGARQRAGAISSACAQLLLPKDYVRFRLTGEFATEVSDASGTALFDVVNRRWSFEMMDGAGPRPRHSAARATNRARSPACVDAAGGRSSPGSPQARRWWAAAATRLSSAVGNGIVEAGIVSCTLGTSGRGLRAHGAGGVRSCRPRPHLLPRGARQVARDGRHAGRRPEPAMVPQPAGARAQLTTRSPPKPRTRPRGAQGLFWLPYLMGERTPHLDATARGGWIGLTASHTRADLIRAVIEGVSYSQRDCLDIIEELGVPVTSVRGFGRRRAEPLLARRCWRHSGNSAW